MITKLFYYSISYQKRKSWGLSMPGQGTKNTPMALIEALDLEWWFWEIDACRSHDGYRLDTKGKLAAFARCVYQTTKKMESEGKI